MNDDEWATVKSKFDEKAHEYGLWEAIPEAVGSAVGFKILTAPLKSLVGEKLTGNILEKLATGAGRFAATAGEELTTETITQKGQGKIEYDIGLRDKQPTTREAFNEVYGQTVALTGIMGAGAKSAHKAYTTFVKKDKPADLLNPEAGGQPGEKEHTEQPVQTPVSEQAPKLTATNVSDQMDTSAAAPVNEEYSNRSAGPVTIPQQNLNPSLQKDAQIPEAPVQPHEKTSLFE